MGWKAIRDHYRIEHIVRVRGGKILIGSSYVPEIIEISPDGRVVDLMNFVKGSDLFERYFAEMSTDPAKVAELFAAADTFDVSIPVFTYESGSIVEKQCEVKGWPNVTHDGELMYNNVFSTDKRRVVDWALRNAMSGENFALQRIARLTEEIATAQTTLMEFRDDFAKLSEDYPEALENPQVPAEREDTNG